MKKFILISPISINTRVDSFEFTKELKLEKIPNWFRTTKCLENLNWFQKDDLSSREYAFVSRYEIDERQDFKENETFNEQIVADQKKMLLSLKLENFSRLQLDFSFQFEILEEDFLETQMTTYPKWLYVTGEQFVEFSECSLMNAKEIFENIQISSRTQTLWTPITFYWSSLLAETLEIKFCLIWFAIEGIFGPINPGETSFQLGLRISRFLKSSKGDRLLLNKSLKKSYALRSNIAHGKSSSIPQEEIEMYFFTEKILIEGLKKIWTFQNWANDFSDKKRDKCFLEACFDE